MQSFTKELHQFLVKKFKNIDSEDAVLAHFNSNLFRKDEISVFEINEMRQNGIIRKAGEKGEIWVELEDGVQSFYHKEIKHLY